MLNADPTIEQAIVDAFVDLLQGVEGMVTVCDGRVAPFNTVELPAAKVLTPKTESDDIGGTMMDHTLSVSIVLYLADNEAQRAIRAMRSRVYAAIGAAEITGSGPFAVPGVHGIGDPAAAQKCIQQGDFIGSAQIALTITYRTARWAM